MKVAILLIVALLAGTYECAASCATLKCESSCHHDKKAPEACSHELVLDRVVQVQHHESIAAIQAPPSIAPSPEPGILSPRVLPSRDLQAADVFTPLRI